MNKKNNNKIFSVNSNFLDNFFVVFSIFVLALAVVYVYTVIATSFNIIEKKQADNKVSELSSDISDLELQYLELEKNIDVEMARNLGFQEVKDINSTPQEFVVRKVKLNEISINEI